MYFTKDTLKKLLLKTLVLKNLFFCLLLKDNNIALLHYFLHLLKTYSMEAREPSPCFHEAIYTLNELGLSVPKDISIVGFDNIQEHMLLPVPLDTISAMNTRMPEVAVDVLIKTINTPTAVEKQQYSLKVELIKRGSV